MTTFRALYSRIRQEVSAQTESGWEGVGGDDFDKSQLNCLFSPEQYPVNPGIHECLQMAKAGA